MVVKMNRISTHVLDMARGKPASGVPVRLERRDPSGTWRLLHEARTDDDGRCRELLLDSNLVPGIYRLAFGTASYFDAQAAEALYPEVEVTFQVREGESHFHIPLLLNANGYTTYRGS